MRKLFIGGNWKCNNTVKQSQELVLNVINKMSYDASRIGSSFFESFALNGVSDKQMSAFAQ